MKVAVVSKERTKIENKLKEFGFTLDKRNPDLVIAFGGDGTALYAERIYPGIPRILIKRRKDKIDEKKLSRVFLALKEKKFKIKEEIKVEGILNRRKKLIGLNEIGVHHKTPIKTIRLKVKVNEKTIAEELIGDGIIVATPYGSTAYFYSICKRKFSKGLGIAFNNAKTRRKCFIVKEGSRIKVEVLREEGWVTADNDERMIPIKKGDEIIIKKAKEKARIIEIEGKRRIFV